jgi:hypothetical protein
MINWNAVIEAGFSLPEELSQQAALDELLVMLTDPDPVVRDELAYTVLEHLIPELDEAACLRLGDELARPELHVRSFAALVLAPVVKRGVFRPAWLAEFEAWYPRELDLRGWDAQFGWLPAAGAASWLDPIAADLGADEAEHVLPRFANMIRVLQALYVFADRGVHRSWDGGAVLSLPHKDTVKARIGEILQVAMPYAALRYRRADGAQRARQPWIFRLMTPHGSSQSARAVSLT